MTTLENEHMWLVFKVGQWAAMVVVARGRLAAVSGGSGGGQRSDNSGIYQWM